MRVLRIHNEERKFVEYPRHDMKPIEGLDTNIKFYEIINNPVPQYDSRIYKLIKTEQLTDDEHLGRYEFIYSFELLSTEQIIENLNISVGEHLDTLYPEWERSKHAGESLRFVLKGQENWDLNDLSRIQYIQNTANWCRNCRELRDEYEKNLIDNNILPDFNWPDRPPKFNN